MDAVTPKRKIVIETQVPKNTFLRLSLLMFFQNKMLYVYLVACAIVTFIALSQANYGLLIVAWFPYVMYVVLGIVNAMRGAQKEYPVTRYTFDDKAVLVENSLGKDTFSWVDFKSWRNMLGCYILLHNNGFMLAIPHTSVGPGQMPILESLLRDNIIT